MIIVMKFSNKIDPYSFVFNIRSIMKCMCSKDFFVNDLKYFASTIESVFAWLVEEFVQSPQSQSRESYLEAFYRLILVKVKGRFNSLSFYIAKDSFN